MKLYERFSYWLYPLQKVSQDEVLSRQEEIVHRFQALGLEVPPPATVSDETRLTFFTLDKYESFLPQSLIINCLVGLDERVTNHLTGLALSGELVDAEPDYTKSFSESVGFFEFLVIESLGEVRSDQVNPDELEETRQTVMLLLLLTSLSPSTHKPSVPELEKLLSSIISKYVGEDFLQQLQVETDSSLLRLLESAIQVYLVHKTMWNSPSGGINKIQEIAGEIGDLINKNKFTGLFEVKNGTISTNLEHPVPSRVATWITVALTGGVWSAIPAVIIGGVRAQLATAESLNTLQQLYLLSSLVLLANLLVIGKRINYRKKHKKLRERFLTHEIIHRLTVRADENSSEVRLGLKRLVKDVLPIDD